MRGFIEEKIETKKPALWAGFFYVGVACGRWLICRDSLGFGPGWGLV